jgi:hypothetical protein
MAKAKKPDELGKTLEDAVNGMLKMALDKELDSELRLKILDRGLKYWALKNKIADGSLGAGFRDDDDEQEP